jgi:hypothetical protein
MIERAGQALIGALPVHIVVYTLLMVIYTLLGVGSGVAFILTQFLWYTIGAVIGAFFVAWYFR